MTRAFAPALGAALLMLWGTGCQQRPQGSERVGREAPDFTLRTVSGDSFTLSAFKGRKVVVLGIGNPFG